ncbi:hypothetical protein SEUCBS140593_002044 [Sporothrix eucalyptigena]|uniref:DUF7136 domain-containing protein n=1 Tax=Sporothrix eucalyptigena TaxID=1812306 RepID=A0ABP0B3C3_9PEZI
MAAADSIFPQNVNISLIFPRNETYDSTSGILPVIFSLTNKAYAVNLYPDIAVTIARSSGEGNDTALHRTLFMDNPFKQFDTSLGIITTSGDTIYLYTAVPQMTGYEGTFYLGYSMSLLALLFRNDSDALIPSKDFAPMSDGSLGFTLKRGTGTSLADFVAGTANTSCADVPFAWPLTIIDVETRACNADQEMEDPGVTCAYLANNTLGVVADYDGDQPFVNMSTIGFGCAPTMDAAAAAAVASGIVNASCGPPGNITCPANATGGPYSNMAPVSAPGLAAAMAIVLGAVAGAVLL